MKRCFIFTKFITTTRAKSLLFPKIQCILCGESLDELKSDMEYFLHALNRPVLKKEEIRFAPVSGI
jgi:hypothetical protein